MADVLITIQTLLDDDIFLGREEHDALSKAAYEIERLRNNVEKLVSSLVYIETFDPEIIFEVESKFHFDLFGEAW